MNEVRFTLTENARLAPNVYRLRLAGDASAITAPGQFLELSIPGFFSDGRFPSATGRTEASQFYTARSEMAQGRWSK